MCGNHFTIMPKDSANDSSYKSNVSKQQLKTNEFKKRTKPSSSFREHRSKPSSGFDSHTSSHNSSYRRSLTSRKSKQISHHDSSYSNTVAIPSHITSRIHKIESLPGAIMVRNESAINTAGYFVERIKLNSTEYSQILQARKGTKSKQKVEQNSQIVVKITNLAECSPRFRINLLKNSIRIMRFLSTLKRNSSTSIFIKIFEIFQMDSVKLYVFMEECQPSPTLYDLVKSPTPIKVEDIRNYFKAIVSGVNSLQKIGVSHRYLKLQHILFDHNNQPKLCGWSKSVFAYDLNAKKILLQNEERRVRRNYFLPPEAFTKPYNPLKADIWSLGVILVAMSTKRYPFNVRDEKNKFSNQWRDFIQKHELNTNVRSLCNKIFIINPKKRYNCENILAHNYFKVPKANLLSVSIHADNEMLERESSRVGAVSAIDMDLEKTTDEQTCPDQEGQIEDGGQVGQEENLSPNEAYAESQTAEICAPEESECKAEPQEEES